MSLQLKRGVTKNFNWSINTRFRFLIGQNHCTLKKKMKKNVMFEPSITRLTGRYWVFTAFVKPTLVSRVCGYCVWQEEVCPATKKHHWQGYIEMKKKSRFRSVQKAIGDMTARLDLRRGTQEEAIKYCKKLETSIPGSTFEFGTPSKDSQGTRSDLREICDLIKEQKTPFDEIIMKDSGTMSKFVQYHRGLESLDMKAKAQKKIMETTCIVLYGDTGTNKTRSAVNFGEEIGSYYILPNPTNKDGSIWFDQYSGERVLIIDDFDGWINLAMLLRICDITPMLLPIKGGFKQKNWSYVIFTTNVEVKGWYPNCIEKHQMALERRIKQVYQTRDMPPKEMFLELLKHIQTGPTMIFDDRQKWKDEEKKEREEKKETPKEVDLNEGNTETELAQVSFERRFEPTGIREVRRAQLEDEEAKRKAK
jgi:hypothetical protein